MRGRRVFLAISLAAACASPTVRLRRGAEVAIDAPVACPSGADCSFTRPRLLADCPARLDLSRGGMTPWIPIPILFSVQEDGRVADVQVPENVPEGLAASIRGWLSTCRFEAARDADGRPTRVRASQAIQFVDPPWKDDRSTPSRSSSPLPCVAPDGGAPADVLTLRGGAAGWTKPSADRGCVARSFRPPPDYRPQGVLSVRFAVLAGGEVKGFHVLTKGVPDDLACQVWHAVRSCTWKPGSDPDGRAVSMWVILPMAFGPPRTDVQLPGARRNEPAEGRDVAQ
jgi:hypothetical protein